MADKTGYIGRNPNDSAVTVARQFFTASGVTTTFTFASGYLTGYLDVYVDGVKRRVADEFTATDGSTFDVLQGGVSAGSTVEAVAYKAFNAAAISGDITGNFDVSGNSTLGGSLSVTGGTTLSNLNVTGITTLGAGTTVAFANTAFNLSGTPDISVDLLSAVDINVSGAATIGGVLTYEDVTNIDSVGIVTARTGVEVTANGLVVNAGVSTFAADVSIADKIVHTGDTNTAIRFPSADTITAETAGVERLRIDSTGDVGLVGIATATGLVVVAGSGVYAGHTGVVTAVTFDGNLTGSVTGAATQVTVADESSDTTCFPLFVTAATGDLAPKSGTNLSFNSSSGRLDATQFNGNFVGGTVSGTTGTFSSDVDIADKIVHTGDTNTAIRFPAGDTFSIETGATEALRVDSSQRLVVGADASVQVAGSHPFVQHHGNKTTTNLAVAGYANNSGGSILALGASRSTTVGTPGTVVSNNDILGDIRFAGDDGTDINSIAAAIRGEVDGAPGSNDMPGRLVFATTADGAASATERARIDSSGRFYVGGTTNVAHPNMDDIIVGDASGNRGITVASATNGFGTLAFGDSTDGSGTDRYRGFIEYYHDDDSMRLGTISTEKLRINQYGTLGVGCIPNDLQDGYDAVQIGGNLMLNVDSTGAGAGVYMSNNVYRDRTNSRWEYINTDEASQYVQANGEHIWRYAASGSADAAITWSEGFRLDTSGRLLIGTTTARTDFYSGTLGADIQLEDSSYCAYSAYATNGNAAFIFGRGNPISGSVVGNLSWMADDGTDEVEAARISAQIDATPGSNDMPGRLVFSTTADGASSTTERMRINSSGVIIAKNGAAAEIDTLSDGATVTPNLDASVNFTITLGGNRTLANPSAMTAGQSGSIFVVQDGTGSRSFNSFGSYWDFIGGTTPTFTSAANAVDRIDYVVRSSTKIHAVFTANYS